MIYPTKEENPDGLHQRFKIQHIDGQADDPNAEYFVLRLDSGGEPHHVAASRQALLTYALGIKHHLPKFSDDLVHRFFGNWETKTVGGEPAVPKRIDLS
jgi:hypothetical protein